jgi:hypothetical protein
VIKKQDMKKGTGRDERREMSRVIHTTIRKRTSGKKAAGRTTMKNKERK